MKPSKSFTRVLLALALAVAGGCQSKSPTEPARTVTTPQPPTPVVTYNILVVANPALAGFDLLRIYFYDAPPANDKLINPIDASDLDLASTAVFVEHLAALPDDNI